MMRAGQATHPGISGCPITSPLPSRGRTSPSRACNDATIPKPLSGRCSQRSHSAITPAELAKSHGRRHKTRRPPPAPRWRSPRLPFRKRGWVRQGHAYERNLCRSRLLRPLSLLSQSAGERPGRDQEEKDARAEQDGHSLRHMTGWPDGAGIWQTGHTGEGRTGRWIVLLTWREGSRTDRHVVTHGRREPLLPLHHRAPRRTRLRADRSPRLHPSSPLSRTLRGASQDIRHAARTVVAGRRRSRGARG